MLDIVSNEMMRRADRYTIDTLGISGEELMLRASKGIFDEVKDYDDIAIVVGSGNNGGDGICLAMLLIEAGKHPTLYMFSRETRGEAKYYFDKISDYDGIKVVNGEEDYSHHDVIVDCIFGTGLKRDVEGIYAKTIENINNSGVYVVSVDIPSGLNGDNGAVNKIAIFANKTISIGSRKLGHYLQNGKDYVGDIVNKDIGITLRDKPYHLLTDDDISIKGRLNNTHKGTYGRVAIIGGSLNYVGAPKLACMGANSLMSGAGLVRLCVPKESVGAYGAEVVECTLYPMRSDGGNIIYEESELRPLIDMEVIAVGMGIGDSDENMDILRYLLKNYTGRLLIDADGINALARDISMLEDHLPSVVLTPHVKEMSRLTSLSTKEILSDATDVAISFAKKYGVTLLLKGTSTIVTDGEETYIVNRGAPSMAKAGSGDVLSGVITGLLAHSDKTPLDATYTGAYIAGVAGEMAGREYGDHGALASDTARYTSYAVKLYTK